MQLSLYVHDGCSLRGRQVVLSWRGWGWSSAGAVDETDSMWPPTSYMGAGLSQSKCPAWPFLM